MKIFITGITGFVGSTLANKFIQDGFEVAGLGRRELLPGHIDDRCEYIKANITKSIAAINADIVIHAAAQVDDAAGYAEHYNVNVNGTRNVLQACARKNIVFILISTSSVYSFNKSSPFVETEAGLPFDALSDYGKTKFLAEKLVVENTELKRKIILRPRAIYGPNDTVLLPRLLKLLKGNRLIVPAHLTEKISLTHVYNLVAAVEKCFEYFPNETAVFNVADAAAYSLKEALPALVKTTVKRPLKIISIPAFLWNAIIKINGIFNFLPHVTHFGSRQLTQVALLNTAKIKTELNFFPEFDFYSFVGETERGSFHQ